ncbi:unnamed protein product [Prorocentrum cordatum]|uniref:Cellulase n=1 Tax=Prorocentrum cordatum TaxID=2364126 RepID=A0ABN9TE50_9DINO|nr:unnamed protein product [Polarella glacialis]|mmetsp:Transcript_15582/g.41679  ORF Transcript_15582/g.41679 Transcript_15582/m.41679 type:complete len:398 (+) Transcript_15582:89-1282(+)
MGALAVSALVLVRCVAQVFAVEAESRRSSQHGRALMRVDGTGMVRQLDEDKEVASKGAAGHAFGEQAEEDIFQHASDVASGDTFTSPSRQSLIQVGSFGAAGEQGSLGDVSGLQDALLNVGPVTNGSSFLDEGVNWHLVASEGAGSCGTDKIRTLSVGHCHGSAPFQYKITDASGGQWVQFKSSTCIFTSSPDLNIQIDDVSSSSGHIKPGAKFCKACGAGGTKFGDSCWGVVADDHRHCGCNSGGWTGTGFYYGGYKHCNRCACWGGGFSGIRTNGQQKGRICTNGLKIYISKPVDCAWGEYGSWGKCSKSCGGGTRQRTRTEKSPAKGGGKPCEGSTTESGECNTKACPTTTTTTTTTTTKKNAKSASICLCQPVRALIAVMSVIVLRSSLPMPS